MPTGDAHWCGCSMYGENEAQDPLEKDGPQRKK